MKFGDKIIYMRGVRAMTQEQLGKAAGITKRAVAAYETEGVIPHRNTMKKLAAALQVSYDYLNQEEITDPKAGLDKMDYMDRAEAAVGTSGADDISALLSANEALFAGGSLDEAAKDVFYQAITKAYIESKLEAKKKFGRKKASGGVAEHKDNM